MSNLLNINRKLAHHLRLGRHPKCGLRWQQNFFFVLAGGNCRDRLYGLVADNEHRIPFEFFGCFCGRKSVSSDCFACLAAGKLVRLQCDAPLDDHDCALRKAKAESRMSRNAVMDAETGPFSPAPIRRRPILSRIQQASSISPPPSLALYGGRQAGPSILRSKLNSVFHRPNAGSESEHQWLSLG